MASPLSPPFSKGTEVVRRHVSRLQELGWLGRVGGCGGWLAGVADRLRASGRRLGGAAGAQSPDPFSEQTRHSVRVGWSAARVQHRGYEWRSARELALEPERWSITVANERDGISRRLPDLAVWPPASSLPAALVIEHGVKREQRRRMVLEGWQAAINSQQYARVQYDCSSRCWPGRSPRSPFRSAWPAPSFMRSNKPRSSRSPNSPLPRSIHQLPQRPRHCLRPSAPLRRPNRHPKGRTALLVASGARRNA